LAIGQLVNSHRPSISYFSSLSERERERERERDIQTDRETLFAKQAHQKGNCPSTLAPL